MKLSARNVIKGKVIQVTKGQTTAHVKIEIAAGAVITASITNEAVDELKLKTGDAACAVIKASDVMVACDLAACRTTSPIRLLRSLSHLKSDKLLGSRYAAFA
jgi:molybdopterin-binding protein